MRRITPLLGVVALALAFLSCLRLVPRATDWLEVCGLGTVQLDAGREAESAFIDRIAGAARVRWFKALQDSASPRAQASRLAMLSVDADLSAAAMQAARNELIRLAMNSPDPAVYGLALDRCREAGADDPPCQQLSWDRWAQLEPDNGAPWLKLAGVAHQQADAAAEAAAFERLSQARTIEFYSRKVLIFAEPYLPDDVTPLQRRAIFTDAIRLTLPVGWQYLEISRLCSSERIQKADTKSGCGAIAETLIEQGGDLADLDFGRRLARRLGWPEARLSRIDTHAEALLAVTTYGDKDFRAVWLSCPEVADFRVWTRDAAQQGFLAAADAKLARSGFTEEELAAKWRLRTEQWRAARAGVRNSDQECRP